MKQTPIDDRPYTLQHPDYEFLQEISNFLQYGMIGKSTVKKHLSWLHHLYVTPGNVKYKLDQLPKLQISPAIQQQLNALYKTPGAKILGNINLIEGFNQLLQNFIKDLQYYNHQIKSYKQQRSFVVKQLQVEMLTHSYSFNTPPTDIQKKLWVTTTERLYQILQQLYYLVKFEIGETYFGFDPEKYTVLQPELATALQIRNSYKPLDNILSRTHSISFYGPENILPYITDISKYLIEKIPHTQQTKVGSLSNHPKVQTLFKEVTLPQQIKKALTQEIGQHIKTLKKIAIQHQLQSQSYQGITIGN
jgi:hypothetical protein